MKVLVKSWSVDDGREKDLSNALVWAITESEERGALERVEITVDKLVGSFARLLEHLVETKKLTLHEAYDIICQGSSIVEEIKEPK